MSTPPFGSIRKAAMALYQPPFRYDHGYIYDSKNEMVADHGGSGLKDTVKGSIAAQVRGWGRIGYMPNGAALQDEVGLMLVEALNTLYDTDRTAEFKEAYMEWSFKTDWVRGTQWIGKYLGQHIADAMSQHIKELEATKSTLYSPAAEEAVQLLLAMGYHYIQSPSGLNWVEKTPIDLGDVG